MSKEAKTATVDLDAATRRCAARIVQETTGLPKVTAERIALEQFNLTEAGVIVAAEKLHDRAKVVNTVIGICGSRRAYELRGKMQQQAEEAEEQRVQRQAAEAAGKK